jgi:hypothetical protein
MLKKIQSQMIQPLEDPLNISESAGATTDQEGTAEMVKDFLFVREKESKMYY